MHVPIWALFIVLSLGGTGYLWSRVEGGDYDFSPMFWMPVGLAWFLFAWLVYFIAFAH